MLIRDALVFQAKLLVDGARDVALAPVSIAAAIADLAMGEQGTRHFFYRVVLLGRRSEDWIDLFEAGDRLADRDGARERSSEGLDDAFHRLEAALVEQYERGGVTASAKQTIDRVLDSLSRRASSRVEAPRDGGSPPATRRSAREPGP